MVFKVMVMTVYRWLLNHLYPAKIIIDSFLAFLLAAS